MISVTFDTAPLLRAFDELTRRQLPFATARALTTTARDAALALKSHLADDFTIRTRWLASGIRVNPATKSHLVAEVGSRDEFMALQATGGEKVPRDGGAIAVPEHARPTPTAITRPSQWPGKLLARSRYFVKPLESGDLGVFRRDKGALVLMYALKRRVEVRQHWHFDEIVERVVGAKWARNCELALADALRSARKS